ncbi:MAG: hypothetical protein JWL81_658 [Verrucomicrobiales bacterium]|nr:hypothetical protein [Verrucomicrobiales bacterium]
MNKKWIIITACAAAGLFLTALPVRADYETAPYTVVKKAGATEIRDYPALKVVSVGMKTDTERDDRFRRLFAYISGGNAAQSKIAMTTPVFMDKADATSVMSFVVPATVAAAGAPVPTGEGVQLGTRPAGRFAVLRFNGLQSTANEKAALSELEKWMAAEKLTATGQPVIAYYDSPWTPGPWRRNEVMLPLPLPAATPAAAKEADQDKTK